ncbi:MAG: nuclear transport factor 2 family protein [Aeromicrobium sp.]|uniref:nuclear transport factor 2 family protein n=1 Tax=Aeromicrobium sp. TaxID=1871063 RepID=UPI00260B5A4A|nr:nuclear transport factor 2 family protein [Aeromicrobium sp.]MDF1703535.1 nuclear transport factor 2 family protein [Aeromicrobium sp.]
MASDPTSPTTDETVPGPVRAWHALVADPDPATLRGMLADDVTFHSPAVHTPQEGPDRTFAYLWAALAVLGPELVYQREWYTGDSAVLEFTSSIDGLDVHGVDLITWDEAGSIVDFTVMARPLRGLQALITAMGAELQKSQP